MSKKVFTLFYFVLSIVLIIVSIPMAKAAQDLYYDATTNTVKDAEGNAIKMQDMKGDVNLNMSNGRMLKLSCDSSNGYCDMRSSSTLQSAKGFRQNKKAFQFHQDVDKNGNEVVLGCCIIWPNQFCPPCAR